MTEPCHCPAYDPSCTRRGAPMSLRDWELCSGNCPPERPCKEDSSERYRAAWDRLPAFVPPATDSTLLLVGQTTTTPTPSLGERVLSAGRAYARWVAAGMPRTPPDELAKRQAACDSCPYRVLEKGVPTCAKCGCPLGTVSLLAGVGARPGKLEMATEECPLPGEEKRWKALH